MAMAETVGAVCKCRERRGFVFRDSLGRKIRKNLLNVSTISFFRDRLFFRRRSLSPGSCIISMDAQEKSRSRVLESSKQRHVPIFVMMPADTFGIDDTSGSARIRKIKALTVSLKALKLAGVHGIAVEVWWGIAERISPFAYNWTLYEELFKLICRSGLKVHAALSFHSNVHSTFGGKGGVSLPLWIQEIGAHNKDIYYQDKSGFSNDDYLTLGVDHFPLFFGRTALQCYEDFIFNFVNKFDNFIGSIIEEISIGLGPSGELRYPAHPFGDGRWEFPGIGEFQCYDKYMMDDLKVAASQIGKPHWGEGGPLNTGGYNNLPFGVPFFEEGDESFLSDYGHFFLDWYSGRLIHHADDILGKAANMLKKYQENKQTSVILVAKIGGMYWWYKTASHPAELTAGYYNTAGKDGYDPIASMLSRHGAALHVPCLEMRDSEIPAAYLCSPEGFLQQIRSASKKRVVHLIGRNSSERFDKAGLWQIHANCYHPQAEVVKSFTFFRLNEKFFRVENWNNFVPFVRMMSSDS